MSRTEFTKPTKRLANIRADGKCEAVGPWYGLPVGTRCNAPLGKGRQHDHINLEANSHDNSLENCAVVCIRCHAHKTARIDIPRAAKTLRMQDNHNGVTKPKQTIRQRKALKAIAEKGSSHHAYLERMERKGKPVPQRRLK
jgi:5-methylcytosine-specific restriction protein A